MQEPEPRTGVLISKVPPVLSHTGANRESFHRHVAAVREGWASGIEAAADWLMAKNPELGAEFVAHFYEPPPVDKPDA